MKIKRRNKYYRKIKQKEFIEIPGLTKLKEIKDEISNVINTKKSRWADSLAESAGEDYAKNARLNHILDKQLLGISPKSNPGLNASVMNRIKLDGAEVIFDNTNRTNLAIGNPLESAREKLKEVSKARTQHEKEVGEKIAKSFISPGASICWNEKDISELAHEWGHLKNKLDRDSGKLVLPRPQPRKEFINPEAIAGTKVPARKLLKDGWHQLLEFNEENRAWKNGKALLKESGATDKELSLANRTEKLSKGTYYSKGKARVKLILANQLAPNKDNVGKALEVMNSNKKLINLFKRR